MRLPEEKKIVPILNSANYGAGVSLDSINMKGFHRACFILTFGAVTGNAVLTVNSGATDAALTSALTFNYAIGGGAIAAASADVIAATATSAALTLTAGTYASKMLIVEVDASDMDVANAEEWLTLAISSAASSGICHAVAILESRYTKNRSLTTLA